MTAPSDNAPASEVLFTARTDVTVEPQGEKFVVHDARKNSFTQLGTAEYIVFRCFDGRTSIQDIVDRLQRERGVVASPAQVARLRDRLHDKQLVLAPGEVVKAEDAKLADSGGLIARLVMIPLPLAWNPDVFLTRAYHRIKYVVFRPAFFVVLCLLLAAAVMVWIQSIDAIRLQATKLDVKRSFVLYYVCVSATFFLHECAHGVVCKGFGGKVPKIGAFLYFFVAVYYTDVSASWMFPSKFRRLMVLFAGAVSNLAVCALATLVWRITIQGSPVNQLCFALMTINALAASFTLFPLLRGDGYYILSTATDTPNLRQNAQRYTGALLRKLFVGRRIELPKATAREALIYLCYAPLQILFVIGFFGYAAIRASAWLVSELHFLGFWIIVIVVLDRVARPVLRIVPGSLALIAEALRLGLSRGPLALLALLVRPVHDAARGLVRRWWLVLVVVAPIAVLAVIPYPRNISAPFEVVSTGPVHVRTRTRGIVKQYAVATDSWVNAGDIVASLADDEFVIERGVAVAELEQAKAKLAELETGYRREDRERARIALDAEDAHTALAERELDRVRHLYDQEIASRKDLDAANAAVQTGMARGRAARAAHDLLVAGYRREELDAQRARVEGSGQALAVIDQQLAWTKVHAEAEGRVITRPYELAQRLGTRVEPGDAVVEIVSPSRMAARLSVPERWIGDVNVAMPVVLRLFADPAVAYGSRLDAIEPIVVHPHDDGGAGTIGVWSNLGHLGMRAPFGATGIAKIDAGTESILGLIARRGHRAAWVIFWSWW